MRKFEDVIAWQKSKDLTILIYKLFSKVRDFSFKNQIERASVSIMNNIAEGFERNTDKELKQFLYISKGSCGEVRSMSYLAESLGYINKNEFESINNLSLEVSRILAGFIKKL
jgi:four helix bundle protein